MHRGHRKCLKANKNVCLQLQVVNVHVQQEWGGLAGASCVFLSLLAGCGTAKGKKVLLAVALRTACCSCFPCPGMML